MHLCTYEKASAVHLRKVKVVHACDHGGSTGWTVLPTRHDLVLHVLHDGSEAFGLPRR